MALFRPLPAQIWTDDVLLSMSPEQKLIFVYLHSCPCSSQCGIFRLQIKTMGFHLGYTQTPVESSLKGLCAAFPDFVAYDPETVEVALLQYPKLLLTNANSRVLNIVKTELNEVQSIELLRRVIDKNSASLSQMYLTRLRQLQAEKINKNRLKSDDDDFNGDVIKVDDNQEVSPKSKVKEIKVKESKEKIQKASTEKKPFQPPNEIEVKALFEREFTEAKVKNSKDWADWETSKFFKFYGAKEWKVGKLQTQMKNWKTAVMNWASGAIEDGIGKKTLPDKYAQTSTAPADFPKQRTLVF